jgi:GH15 family glucan-1,4-alpha-glucosidase
MNLVERADFWARRASKIRDRIENAAWRDDTSRISSTFEGDNLDASLIQLLDLRFFKPDDPRFQGTLKAVEKGLRRGSYMLRYDTEDDFGLPETAFNVCTFWLIEALQATGRESDARNLFEQMLARRTAAGLLSEDIDPETGELWGNYPQTYSLVGIINCAVLLSNPWSSIR